MNKKFISIQPMKQELLAMLQEKFNNTEYNATEKLSVELDLRKIIDDKLKEIEVADPVILISANAKLKLDYLVDDYSTEVAWHMLIERYERIFIISDILIFPQVVTSIRADGIDTDYEMWLATLPDEQFEMLRGHGHSHVNMGVTPSGVDETYYSDLMTHVKDYYITLIQNKSGQQHVRFYDKENNIVYTDIEIHPAFESGEIVSAWHAQYKDLVKEPKPTTLVYNSGTSGYTRTSKTWWDRTTPDDYTYPYKAKEETYIMVMDCDGFKSRAKDMDEACSMVIKNIKENFRPQNLSPKKIKKELEKTGCLVYDTKKNKFLFDLTTNMFLQLEQDPDILTWEVWDAKS